MFILHSIVSSRPVCYTTLTMWNWDYQLPKNWKPKTDEEWEWYLVRKINYEDLKGITKDKIAQYFPAIARYLDPGKRIIIEHYLKKS